MWVETKKKSDDPKSQIEQEHAVPNRSRTSVQISHLSKKAVFSVSLAVIILSCLQ